MMMMMMPSLDPPVEDSGESGEGSGAHRICLNCRYDLSGSPADEARVICPECGLDADEVEAYYWKQKRRRWGEWQLVGSMILIFGGFFFGVVVIVMLLMLVVQ